MEDITMVRVGTREEERERWKEGGRVRVKEREGKRERDGRRERG